MGDATMALFFLSRTTVFSDDVSHECRTCHGSGIETVVRCLGPMIQQMQGACSTCRGEICLIALKT